MHEIAYLWLRHAALTVANVQGLVDASVGYQLYARLALSAAALAGCLMIVTVVKTSSGATSARRRHERWWAWTVAAAVAFVAWRRPGGRHEPSTQVLTAGSAVPSQFGTDVMVSAAAGQPVPPPGVVGLVLACLLSLGCVALMWESRLTVRVDG